MWSLKLELGLLVFFVLGSCVMYNRVFQICFDLKQSLRNDPSRYRKVVQKAAWGSHLDILYNKTAEHNSTTVVKSDETYNYIHKVVNLPGLHFSMEAVGKNPTSPTRYPNNGTGLHTKVAYRFNISVLNSFCKISPDLVAIVPIYSRPDGFMKRLSLRGTLGQECKTFKCKLFFIVGMSKEETVNDLLRQEYDTNKDMLIMGKMDTYRDLNNKAVVMLNWIIKHCRGPRYVIRLIDDVHLNLPLLFPQLDAITSKRYMFGYISTGRKPIRTKKSKFYISEKEWPFVDFPDYLTGTMIAFRTGLAEELRRNALKAPYCWIEDVWFAGTVRLQSNIPLISTKMEPYTGKPGTLNPEYINNYLYIHDLKAKDFFTYFTASKLYKTNRTLST